MLAAYRRFYLYSALSIAVLAVAFGLGGLLSAVLHRLGLGAPAAADELSRSLSLAAAILVFAVPVGGGHLALIVRGLRDPDEAACDGRHRYLNLWLLAACAVELYAGSALISTLLMPFGGDAAVAIAALVVATIIGAVAWWWIERTPPHNPRFRTITARIAMLLAMTVAAFAASSAAGSIGGLLFGGWVSTPVTGPGAGRPPFDLPDILQRQVRTSLVTLAYALVLWGLALVRQWRWREDRDRAVLFVGLYGLGVTLTLFAGAVELAALVRHQSVGADLRELRMVTTPLPALGAGTLLLVVHLLLLRADRGRNGHPATATDRILAAFPAVAGLAALVLGASLGWRAIVRGEEFWYAAALLGAGTLTHVPCWRALMGLTADEPHSAIRRFALFSIVCLSLVATVVAGVVSVYDALTAALAIGDRDSARAALEWFGPTGVAAVTFAVHLALLLRDQRRTRAESPSVARDDLLDLLDEVRRGVVSPSDAAARIRRGP